MVEPFVLQVISKRLPQQQLTTLVFMLFEGLIDSQTNCCRASSVILNTLLKNRGAGLQELVAYITVQLRCYKVITIIGALDLIGCMFIVL